MKRRLVVAPGSQLPGAHHPHCERHANHLIWLGKTPLCLGCTCMTVGVALGIVSVLGGFGERLPFAAWIGVHICLIAPTVFQPWLQLKAYKVLARALLGLACATWIGGLLTAERLGLGVFWEASIGLATMAVMGKLLLRLRSAYTRSPCAECPLGTFPTCDWNLPRIMEDRGYRTLAEALGTVGVVDAADSAPGNAFRGTR